MPAENTLAAIPGEYISAGNKVLAPCGPESTPQMVEVDADQWGRFRIRYRPHRAPRKGAAGSRWFWVADWAERLELGK